MLVGKDTMNQLFYADEYQTRQYVQFPIKMRINKINILFELFSFAYPPLRPKSISLVSARIFEGKKQEYLSKCHSFYSATFSKGKKMKLLSESTLVH